jgi:hypothetical protein
MALRVGQGQGDGDSITAIRHTAGSPFLRLELRTRIELVLMGDVVVPRPFESLLVDPGLGLRGCGKLFDRDEVVLIPDIGVGVKRKRRWSGESLLLVAHRRIDPFLGWQWHLGGYNQVAGRVTGPGPSASLWICFLILVC